LIRHVEKARLDQFIQNLKKDQLFLNNLELKQQIPAAASARANLKEHVDCGSQCELISIHHWCRQFLQDHHLKPEELEWLSRIQLTCSLYQ